MMGVFAAVRGSTGPSTVITLLLGCGVFGSSFAHPVHDGSNAALEPRGAATGDAWRYVGGAQIPQSISMDASLLTDEILVPGLKSGKFGNRYIIFETDMSPEQASLYSDDDGTSESDATGQEDGTRKQRFTSIRQLISDFYKRAERTGRNVHPDQQKAVERLMNKFVSLIGDVIKSVGATQDELKQRSRLRTNAPQKVWDEVSTQTGLDLNRENFEYQEMSETTRNSRAIISRIKARASLRYEVPETADPTKNKPGWFELPPPDGREYNSKTGRYWNWVNGQHVTKGVNQAYPSQEHIDTVKSFNQGKTKPKIPGRVPEGHKTPGKPAGGKPPRGGGNSSERNPGRRPPPTRPPPTGPR